MPREIEINGRYFGQFSLTVVVYGEDRAAVRRAASESFKVFATHGAQLTEERYNLLNAWLAVVPGNAAYNLRRLWLLNVNYADLAFLFAPHVGEEYNRHLQREPLAVLETAQGTPYFFNLHAQDVGHTLVLGATGGGKSFLLNFLLTHAQKYAPVTHVFDLGGGYESLTTLFGGAYVRVGSASAPVRINPFCLPPTPENLQFLFAFVKVLIDSGGYHLANQEEQDLYRQIENVYAIAPDQRRLGTLANILPRPLALALSKWVEGGPYGHLFDNAEDTLTFARFQAFDFEGMDRSKDLLEPLLFYVLHRASAAIEAAELAATFKLFVVDEAWRFLKHPTIKAYMTEALKTWRKRNAAMVLATQSSEDLLGSEILATIVESCPTKLFLANPGMDKASYRQLFHLNETEAALVSALAPKHELLLKRPGLSKVLRLKVDPKSYWLYTNSPFDNEKKRRAFEAYGFEQGLEFLAKEKT